MNILKWFKNIFINKDNLPKQTRYTKYTKMKKGGINNPNPKGPKPKGTSRPRNK